VMASLRNLAISVFRQDDQTNIAAACRHTARDPTTTPDSPRDQVINQTDRLHAMTLIPGPGSPR
ncbi:hypothetical protein ACWCQP_50615, partial [Streptomyces chartreusis]